MKELKNSAKSRIANKKHKRKSAKDEKLQAITSAANTSSDEPFRKSPAEKPSGEISTDGAVRNALIKKATGYIAEETVTEYSFGDGIETPVKKKVTKKEVPPDITAIKMLLGESAEGCYDGMTDEELIAEKNRLIRLLKTESD